MLTPYDEFPVHQAPQPFSYIPSTDYSWDEGYWFAVLNPEEKLFLGIGARVNPDFTFESFVEGKSNQLAKAAARQVADNPGKWLFHCHVSSHLRMGIQAFYVVEP